jgi:hypothetical protein
MFESLCTIVMSITVGGGVEMGSESDSAGCGVKVTNDDLAVGDRRPKKGVHLATPSGA